MCQYGKNKGEVAHFNQTYAIICANWQRKKCVLDSVRALIKVKEKTCKILDDCTDDAGDDNESLGNSESISEITEECTVHPPKRIRKEFTSAEILLVKKHLKHYILNNRSIIRTVFEEDVNGIPALAPLIKRIGISSLITKVRTERKNV